MTGLEKIIQQIQNDSLASADKMTSDAKAKAAVILQNAAAQADKLQEDCAKKMEAETQSILKNAQSGALLEKRKAILVAKQELIAQTITAAKEALYHLPEDRYFQLICKMIAGNALPKKGEIFFCESDLKRLPKTFDKMLDDSLKDIPGASLTVSPHTRPIDGGFVLSYGGIEENCSFEAWFYSHHEELQDRLNAVLFGA